MLRDGLPGGLAAEQTCKGKQVLMSDAYCVGNCRVGPVGLVRSGSLSPSIRSLAHDSGMGTPGEDFQAWTSKIFSAGKSDSYVYACSLRTARCASVSGSAIRSRVSRRCSGMWQRHSLRRSSVKRLSRPSHLLRAPFAAKASA